jgi:prophage tail gpP-like protein
MSDTAEIIIGEYRYSRFKKYRIDSDLYAAAGAFEFELYPDPAVTVKPGDRAQVFVNGYLEMTGIIDKVSVGYDTSGRSINVSGRDLMGLVVDSYCEEWRTMSNLNLVKAAERLLKNVPYANRLQIEADETATRRDAKKPFLQPAPGDKIFDVLKEAAASRGVVFYAKANGSLCFRKPTGRGTVLMNITRRSGEPNTYIIRGERQRDYSERYSKYTVLTQEQGLDEDSPPWINAKASVSDKDVPFFKPFVESMQEDGGSVRKRADMIMEQRRAKSDSVKYSVKGHSQGVYNWAVDELVRVDDDELDVHCDMLIYSRTFELSRQGITTELTLGEAGLVL